MGGLALLLLVKREIASADWYCLHAASARPTEPQDDVILYRLSLGRLLYWLKHGNRPLGATEEDRRVYIAIEKAREDHRAAIHMKAMVNRSRPAS